MPDEKTSVTVVQWVALSLGLLAISGIIWAAIVAGPDIVRDGEKLQSFIKLSTMIVIFTLLLAGLFYFVSSPNTNDSSKSLIDRLTNITPMQWVATMIGLLTVGGMVWVIYTGADFFETAEKARGLITFSVAIVTVAIALLLVFYVVIGIAGDDELKARFTFGKDILMVFVGILGTIMGFYYGSGKVTPEEVKTIQGTAPNTAAAAETKAFGLLLKKDYDGSVKAFDDAYKATPISPNIKNLSAITKYLAENKDQFTTGNDKAKAWKDLYCFISVGNMAVGQSKEINNQFDIGCSPPITPTPSPSP